MGGAHLARWPRTRAARFATETGPGEPFGFSGEYDDLRTMHAQQRPEKCSRLKQAIK